MVLDRPISTVSENLKELKELSLTKSEKRGKEVYYINPEKLDLVNKIINEGKAFKREYKSFFDYPWWLRRPLSLYERDLPQIIEMKFKEIGVKVKKEYKIDAPSGKSLYADFLLALPSGRRIAVEIKIISECELTFRASE